MKKKILIFTYTNVIKDSIVNHQILWLKDDYEVHTICQIPDKSYNIHYINYHSDSFYKRNMRLPLLKLKKYEKYIFNKHHRVLVSNLSKTKYDLIIVHHLRLLPVAFQFAGNAKIILYAHEYYTEAYNQSFVWRFLIKDYYLWLAKNYLKKCELTITVNESIQNFYIENFNIPANYIHNTIDYINLTPSKIAPNSIKIIHHGLASSSRKIELMIEMMKFLDERFTLTLILVTHSKINDMYINKLKKLAKDNQRIFFVEPLPFSEIVKYGNTFDIGLFFMPPTNLNEEYSLAHKIFQFIQSRLFIAISPLPEMKKLVERYDLGVIADDYNPESYAKKLNKLTVEQIDYYKNQSHKAAKELAAENNRNKFQGIIRAILN